MNFGAPDPLQMRANGQHCGMLDHRGDDLVAACLRVQSRKDGSIVGLASARSKEDFAIALSTKESAYLTARGAHCIRRFSAQAMHRGGIRKLVAIKRQHRLDNPPRGPRGGVVVQISP